MSRYTATTITYCIFLFTFFFVAMPISNYIFGNVNNKYGEAEYDDYRVQSVGIEKPSIEFIQVSEKQKVDDELYVKVNSKNDEFWNRVYWIESKHGKFKYQYDERLGYKPKDCKKTYLPCGHLQIDKKALVDIGCNSKKCMADRDDYKKSLAMAKKILAKKLTRYSVSEDWLKYSLYQQGANGLKRLHLASKGKKKLSKLAMKRIARNSIYSMKDLRTMGSKKSAISYLNMWRTKWIDSGLQVAKL